MEQNCLKKWYSIMLPMFPILTLYGFHALPFLTFSDYFLLFFIIEDLIINKFSLVYDKTFMPLILYLLYQPILLLIFSLNDSDFFDAAGTAWKLAAYILGISILGKNIQKDFFIGSTRFVGILSTIYGLFQFILGTYAHLSLSPYLPFLPVLRSGLKEQQDSWIAYDLTVRPRAWFSEPSMFALFLLMALLVELFLAKDGKVRFFFIPIYVIGIILSNSSTGAIGIIILIVAWIIINPQKQSYSIPKTLLIILVLIIPVFAFFLFKSGYIKSFINHTFVYGQGLSSQSHFAYIRSAIIEDNNFLNILFGNGMQEVETGYLPGWFRAYYCMGLIGVILYISVFWGIFNQCHQRSQVIVLIFVVLNFGTEIMLGVFMLLYMSCTVLPENISENTSIEYSPCDGNIFSID